jgi:hypothetical protein
MFTISQRVNSRAGGLRPLTACEPMGLRASLATYGDMAVTHHASRNRLGGKMQPDWIGDPSGLDTPIALESGSGAGTRIRTGDLPLTRRLLYQLSYAGMGRAF